jgi:hypothetical protein
MTPNGGCSREECNYRIIRRRIAVGIASAFIALIAAVAAYATYLSPHSPALETQADTVIKIIQQSSDQGQAYFKLKAFQDTGLITIGEDKLQRLLKGWYTPPK